MTTPDLLIGPEGLVLDAGQRRVQVRGAGVELTRREFDLLRVLLHDRGRVISFAELAERVWDHQVLLGDQRFIYTTAWRLRRALATAGAADVVRGVRGVGYFVPVEEDPVSEVGPDEEEGEDTDEDVAAVLSAMSGGSSEAEVRALVVFDPADTDLRLVMVNDAATALSGHDAATLTNLHHTPLRLWAPAERAIIGEAAQRAIDEGQSRVEGVRLLRADGTFLPLDIVMTRLEVPGRPPLTLAEVTRSESGP